MTEELLTTAEHDAIAKTAELWGALCAITSDGPARDGDLKELIFHIHGIQRAVLKQAAARAYPDLYRLLGGDPPQPPSGPVIWNHEDGDPRCPVCGRDPHPPPREMPPPLPDPVIPSD
jgi:hypothetical protein